MRLLATDIQATYSVKEPFRLPYHSGGMFHGLFGRALRKVACPETPCCEGPCARGGRQGEAVGAGACDWTRLFAPSPRVPPPHRILEGQSEPPSPVVLLIPAPGGESLEAGDTMSFGLRLFGETPGDLGLLERALALLADMPIGTDKGRVELQAITRDSPRDIGASLASEVGMPAADGADRRTARVAVRFDTPVRVKRGGVVTTSIDFTTLFSKVWRRLTMLGALYGDYGADDDATFQRLRALAAKVKTVHKRLVPLTWEHLSEETGERKLLRGVVGHMVFEGESLSALLPTLAAGEVVHIGGGTSFGLGRLEVEVNEQR